MRNINWAISILARLTHWRALECLHTKTWSGCRVDFQPWWVGRCRRKKRIPSSGLCHIGRNVHKISTKLRKDHIFGDGLAVESSEISLMALDWLLMINSQNIASSTRKIVLHSLSTKQPCESPCAVVGSRTINSLPCVWWKWERYWNAYNNFTCPT